MEDALVLHETVLERYNGDLVLILVLMEDALVRGNKISGQNSQSLNPCFNGRCTRTMKIKAERKKLGGLNPCFNGRCTRTKCRFEPCFLH